MIQVKTQAKRQSASQGPLCLCTLLSSAQVVHQIKKTANAGYHNSNAIEAASIMPIYCYSSQIQQKLQQRVIKLLVKTGFTNNSLQPTVYIETGRRPNRPPIGGSGRLLFPTEGAAGGARFVYTAAAVLTEFNWIATPSPNCVGNPGWHRTRKPLAYRVSCYTLSPHLNIPRSFKIVIYLILEHIYTSSMNTFPWQSIPFIYRSLRKCILSYV